jgi:DNA processing protein
MAALKYWIWLSSRKGLGAAGTMAVLDHFATAERAYYADPEEYDFLALNPAARQSLLDKKMDGAEKILADCERLNLRVMTMQDGDYPERLRQLSDPPAVLYIRGRVIHFDEEAAIGVVGAREPSGYGRRAAEKFGMELAAGGALLVSGIAEGLDSCAIRGALKGGGTVVSVLAGGVDVPFPPKHRYLYEDVAAAGALISEYPPGTPHNGYHFPQRNRILSGLCLGVLAVECRSFGGTISTMNHALEQNRDLFAVPGAIDAPLSEGTNRLIQQGAKLVTCGRDILEEYWDRFPQKLADARPISDETVQARLSESDEDEAQPKTAPSAPKPEKAEKKPARPVMPREQQREQFTDDELAILAALGNESRTVDQIVDMTQITARRVMSALTMLQVQGAVEEQAGRRFSALIQLEE